MSIVVVDEGTETLVPAAPTAVYSASPTSAAYVLQLNTVNLAGGDTVAVVFGTAVNFVAGSTAPETALDTSDIWSFGPFPAASAVSITLTLTSGGDKAVPWRVFRL